MFMATAERLSYTDFVSFASTSAIDEGNASVKMGICEESYESAPFAYCPLLLNAQTAGYAGYNDASTEFVKAVSRVVTPPAASSNLYQATVFASTAALTRTATGAAANAVTRMMNRQKPQPASISLISP